MAKKLYKSRKNKIIDGVCGGIAEYFGWDPTIVRIIAVIIACLKGAGIIAYILACIIIPAGANPEDDVENLKSANVDDDDKKSSKKSKNNDEEKEKKLHTDSDFEGFFKK